MLCFCPRRFYHGCWFVLAIVLSVGCSNDDTSAEYLDRGTPQPATDAPQPDTTSALQGGTYGTVVARGVDKSSSPLTETLPTFGIYDGTAVDTRGLDIDSQLFFPFGGFVSTFGPGVSALGNAKTGSQVGLIARLYPNFDLLPDEGFVELYPLVKGDELLCFVTDSETGHTQLEPYVSADADCQRAALSLATFEPNFNAVEFNVDLGSFPEEGRFSFVFRFILSTPDGVVEDAIVRDVSRETYASLQLTTNEATAKPMPSNVYASGNFTPSLNGFGFANAGDASFDLFSKTLIAQEFGKESVCFVEGDECATLNPFGIYLSQVLLPHDGSNGMCNGFSVASAMLATTSPYSDFEGKRIAADYNPQASVAVELNYADVRQLIAAKHIGQFGVEALRYDAEMCPTLRPTDVIERIVAGFNTPDPIALVGIYNDAAGHAVTPYAVSDEGGNIQRIYVYDNNFPSDSHRYIEVDTTPGQESWQYFGSINANAPGSLYAGFELTNPMCPQPLSVYDDPEIAIQLPGTTRFLDFSGVNSQIEDAEGRISGADFERGVNINDIPGAVLGRTLDKNVLTISGLTAPERIAGSVFDTVSQYLNEGYVIRAQPVSEASQEALSFLQSSILRSDLTAALEATFVPDVPLEVGAIQRFQAHKSARLVTLVQPPAGSFFVDAYITQNDRQLGYVSNFEINTDNLEGNDAVGVYIADNGETFSVFSYDSASGGNFIQLRAGIHYAWDSQFLRADTLPSVAQTEVMAQ